MNPNPYLETVISLICNFRGIPDENLDDDSRLDTDCGFDSLDWSELGFQVEDEFNVVVTDETLESWTTIGDISAFLLEHLGEPIEE